MKMIFVLIMRVVTQVVIINNAEVMVAVALAAVARQDKIVQITSVLLLPAPSPSPPIRIRFPMDKPPPSLGVLPMQLVFARLPAVHLAGQA
jgi:hypothetical protein